MSNALQKALSYVPIPWRRRGNTALIEGYFPALGNWVVMAEAHDTPQLSASDVAKLIVGAINRKEQNDVFDELVAALKLCLECDGLSWEAEHDAEIALRRAGEKPERRRMAVS